MTFLQADDLWRKGLMIYLGCIFRTESAQVLISLELHCGLRHQDFLRYSITSNRVGARDQKIHHVICMCIGVDNLDCKSRTEPTSETAQAHEGMVANQVSLMQLH